jgi:[ribosomal protein S5]-alanine N-acetyltransferase
MIVKLITAKDTYPLRHLILWPHKHNLSDCSIEIDDKGIHFGSFKNNDVVSIGSFFSSNISDFDEMAHCQFRLRAMASNHHLKTKGGGKALLLFAQKYLKSTHKADLIWCDAREVAVGFYKKLGFSIFKGPYEIPVIGTHYLMYKKL